MGVSIYIILKRHTYWYLLLIFFRRNENYIWSTNSEFNDADKRIRIMQPSSEYGAVLMAWTLLHVKGKFGLKNTQNLEIYTEAMSSLKLWSSLLTMCQSSAIKVIFFIILYSFKFVTYHEIYVILSITIIFYF